LKEEHAMTYEDK